MATEAPALPARIEAPLAEREPIMDRINPRTLDLLEKSRFKGLSNAELGMALELAAHYDLDPFAGEIWATRSQGRNGAEGQLLIMVGRDGLRKVVMRNGLDMDGDVVRQKDSFAVKRSADRTRTVEHSWEGDAERRGPIVGAWAEVWDRSGKQRGFFFAPMHEYRPTSEKKLQYSPWGSQESVMILAAAERQAARQSTPLSGLLMEGEMDLNDERAGGAIDASTVEDDVALQAVIDSLDVPEELRDRAYAAVKTANEVTPNTMPAMKLQMLVSGKDEAGILAEVEELERVTAEHVKRREAAAARELLREEEAEDVTDAEVVEEDPERAAVTRDQINALENTIADIEAALEDPDVPERDALQDKLNEAELKLRELHGTE